MSSYFSYPLAGAETPDPLRFLPSRPPRDWERIARYGERLRFSAGDVIVREGDLDTSFAIVLEGSLAVDLPWAPRVETGSVFGEIAFLTGAARSATVRAEENGQLLRMSRTAFEVLAARHPELGRSIALELGRIVAERLLREQPAVR